MKLLMVSGGSKLRVPRTARHLNPATATLGADAAQAFSGRLRRMHGLHGLHGLHGGLMRGMRTGLPGWMPALSCLAAVAAFTGGENIAHAAAGPSLTAEVLHTAGETFTSALCFDGASLEQMFGLAPQSEGTAGPGLRGVGIAVLALVALVAIALGRMRLHTENKRLNLAQSLVEQGIEPPSELLMGPARNDLRKGIVLLFAGAGLLAAGLLLGDRGMSAGALVPEFIGVGYLVSFWLTARPLSSPGTGTREP